MNDDEWHTVNYTKKPMEGDLSISVDATTVGLSVYQGDAVSDWLQSLQSVSAVFIAGEHTCIKGHFIFNCVGLKALMNMFMVVVKDQYSQLV